MITVKRFTASWCAPCRALAPVINSLESELPDIKFETIDIETDPETTQAYGIRSIPAVVILKDDTEIDRIIGGQPKQAYIAAIENARK
jgi:thioredoxin 1